MIEMKKKYYTIYNPKHSVASLNKTYLLCYHSFDNHLLRQSDFKLGLFEFITNKFHSHSLIIIVTQIFKHLCPIGDLVNAAIFCFLCKFNAKMIFPSDYFCNNCQFYMHKRVGKFHTVKDKILLMLEETDLFYLYHRWIILLVSTHTIVIGKLCYRYLLTT